MRRKFVLSAIVGLGMLLSVTNVSQAQSYFFGYYYPEERRLHTDRLSGDYSDYYEADGPAYNGPIFGPRPSRVPFSVFAQAPAPKKPQVVDQPANVRIMLPDGGAQVVFGDHVTKSTGTSRLFTTPPIRKSYTYDVKVVWKEAGQQLAVHRQVQVLPGQTAVVDFTEAITAANRAARNAATAGR